MKRIDADPGSDRSRQECYALGNLPVITTWRVATALVIRQCCAKHSHSGADRKTVPERVAIAAYLPHVLSVERALSSSDDQGDGILRGRGYVAAYLDLLRRTHRYRSSN
jgi:hypothetical protein